MRALARTIVMTLVITSAGSAFAARKSKPRSAPHKSPAPVAKHQAHAQPAHSALLAQATPAPQPQQMLILSDYAPNRHALAGP